MKAVRRLASTSVIAALALLAFSMPTAGAATYFDGFTALSNGCSIKTQQVVDGFAGLDSASTWELNSSCVEVIAQVGQAASSGPSYANAYTTGYNFNTVHRGLKNGVIRQCEMIVTNNCRIF